MDPLLILFGVGVSVLVGTTGMGGGPLMTPLLILLFGVKPVVAVGTDLAYAAVTKTVGGSVPGVWVGTGLATRLPERGLRPTLGIVLVASALGLLNKAGAPVPVAAILAVPLALAVLAAVLHLARRASPASPAPVRPEHA